MDDCSIVPSLLLPALASLLVICSCAIIAVAEWHVRLRRRRARLYEHFKQEFKRIRIEMRVKVLQVQEMVAATEEKAANAQVMKRSSGESIKAEGASNSRERGTAVPRREPLLDMAETPRNKSKKDKSGTEKKSKKEKQSERTSKDPSNSKGSGNRSSAREKEGKDKKKEATTEKTDKKSKTSAKSQKSNKTDTKNEEEQKEKSFEEKNKDILR